MNELKLLEIDKNKWKFDWPKEFNKATDIFFEGLEYFEEGNNQKAKKLFDEALAIYPEHIDVLHHLAMISIDKKSEELLEKAYKIGINAFPKEKKVQKLEWGWTENRPFLRVCHFKGLKLLEKGETDEALTLFNQMLNWNPGDNQGVRDIVADIYVKNREWDKIIELNAKYPNDAMPTISFAFSLALFKKGNKEEAAKKLKECVKNLPKCGKILLEKNPKKPKSEMPGYITYGGEDQAYEFWESQGKAWQDADVQELLANILKEIKI